MKCIIHLALDVTDQLPEDWQRMTNQDIKEYFGDTPDLIIEAVDNMGWEPKEFYIVHKVERVE